MNTLRSLIPMWTRDPRPSVVFGVCVILTFLQPAAFSWGAPLCLTVLVDAAYRLRQKKKKMQQAVLCGAVDWSEVRCSVVQWNVV